MITQRSVPGIRLALVGALLLALGACRDDPTGVDPAALSAAKGPTDPLGAVNRLSPELEQRVRALRADLEANGYEVARGYWRLWGADDCKYPLRTVGFCYGNNPAAPYVIAVVPQWKDEFVDQRSQHAILQAHRNMSATFRLDEQEALVVLAELPPAGRYFGIATNVFTRQTSLNASDPIYRRLEERPLLRNMLFSPSPNPSRMMILASIGNTTSNVVMERKSGSPWQQQRYFISTPDEGMADAVTAALLRVGVPTADQVFTEPVAPALVRVGLEPAADDFITYLRYALPEDIAAGEAWRERLPLTILRVRPRSDASPKRPVPIPAYEQRTANFPEAVLAQDLQALIGAVRARWGQPSAPLGPSISAYTFLDLVGQHCLGVGSPLPNRGPMNCLADNPDTDYQITLPPLYIDDGQVIAAVGTLATATGNATYVSLGVNRFPALVGVTNLSDEDLAGTAASFQSALQHDAGLFYVYYLARDCTGLHPCLEISRKLVPVGEQIKLMQRNYVNPGSASGPDPAKVLNPFTITLDGRYRPSSGLAARR
jgi:hypothetical protein